MTGRSHNREVSRRQEALAAIPAVMILLFVPDPLRIPLAALAFAVSALILFWIERTRFMLFAAAFGLVVAVMATMTSAWAQTPVVTLSSAPHHSNP